MFQNVTRCADVLTDRSTTRCLQGRERHSTGTILDRVLLRPRFAPSMLVLLNDDLAMIGRRMTPTAIPIGRMKLFMGLKTSARFTQFNIRSWNIFLASDVTGAYRERQIIWGNTNKQHMQKSWNVDKSGWTRYKRLLLLYFIIDFYAKNERKRNTYFFFSVWRERIWSNKEIIMTSMLYVLRFITILCYI